MVSTPEAAHARQVQTGTTTGRPRGTSDGAKAERDFRPDIQGLRAIAVALVVVYHLFPSLLPGGFVGVDVFFVISGFLITGHLWRGYAKTGKLSLVDFWGRRARRLVPAAALVLAVTWVGARLLLPAPRLAETATEIRASALYYQNWQLAHNAVDYLKSNDAASPVQHFWSLSVEEQFYIVWPLLFVAAALVARKHARAAGGVGDHGTSGPRLLSGPRVLSGHSVAVMLTGALVLASLAYSVYDTKSDPAAAYFVTTTRMWELGIGGLLALLPAVAARRLGRHGWLGWAGLAMIIASQFVIRGATAFPGWIALLPVLGAAAMIAGGSAQGKRGPWRLTSVRPMVFLGGISYSLYLWHWPVIVLFIAWRGHRPGLITGPLIALASIGLAWATKVAVEDRVRLAPFIAKHKWRSVSTALAAVVPVALAWTFMATQPGPWDGRLGPGYPGAAVLASTSASVPAQATLPPPDAVPVPGYWASGCLQGEHVAALKPCVYGDTTKPALTVALVGDSMAGNWWAPLQAIATRDHWKLVTELHATCDWTATQLYDPVNKGAYPTCHDWGVRVLNDLVSRVQPDVVITTSFADMTTMAHPKAGSAARADVGAGEAAYWSQLEAHGIPVIGIRETPAMTSIDVPACVAKYGPAGSKCTLSRAKAVDADPPTSYAAKALGGKVPVIDMNSLICGPARCSPVVGNILVYMDSHHLTQSYGTTLAPFLEQRLLATSPVLRGAS
jgi:peptidoglycan/LPS O-acetylase OafA/YrhL